MTGIRHGNAGVARWATVVAVVVALAVLVVVLVSAGSSYVIHARFTDASQLVSGDSVELGGRGVGSVGAIAVAPGGLANVDLEISDTDLVPLHLGTRATIRALSQAGLANHYVELTPGPPSAPSLRSGAVLPVSQTTSMVNLDAILDSFGPVQRANLQRLIADSGQVFAGSGAPAFAQMLDRLDPAMQRFESLTNELAADRGQLVTVIQAGSTASAAIDARSADLASAVANTATSLGAIASQRQALADSLSRAPAVLAAARTTLGDATTALEALRPTLALVPPAGPPLHGLLTRVNSVLPVATPVVGRLRADLPALRQSLAGLTRLAPSAVKAVTSAGTALLKARPIVTAARYYGSDLLLGVFQGLAGVATANYDRWGHYARLEFTQPYQTSLGGPLSNLLSKPLLPSLFNLRERLLRRCPGGNSPPAPDGSNPWVPNSSICTPSEDTPLSVDFP